MGEGEGVCQDNPFDQYYIRIKSNAFLWHQIRCIVTILFQIGKGVDDESIIDDLLDIEKFKSRPGYPYADPRYLTLTDCVYDPDPFGERYILDQRPGNFEDSYSLDLRLDQYSAEDLQNINNVEGKTYSSIFGEEPKNEYQKKNDPVNVFSNRIEHLLLSSSMYSLMLRKRKPEKAQMVDWKFDNPVSIFKNKLSNTVEENIAVLSGKKQERYKQIVEWKKERGIKDHFTHVKFISEQEGTQASNDCQDQNEKNKVDNSR